MAALHVHSVTFDAADPPAQGRFWAQVFEAPEPEVPNPYVALVHPADQVARLTGLGATVIGTYREYGTYWASLRDPEGNEVCVGTPSPPR